MMALIRWVSVAAAAAIGAALVYAPAPTVTTAVLALVWLALFLIVCWTFGAFRRGAWICDDETSARLDLVDQELSR